MKKITQLILVISIVYTAIFLYFDFDYLELAPVIILLLTINFYLIYKYNNKLLNYLINGLLFIFLIVCFSFGAVLRQDWHFLD
ncbi:hypothetical protein PMI13_03422 [Chryseobacterium populi]|uniref:Uncharacterized protein n=1 Tax=Chryseobacterium populi TaxID=1144316 RepID=J2K6Z1_9FLAO|nr:hypothetical protein PMI13_03422 [Chryseobacterium populi]